MSYYSLEAHHLLCSFDQYACKQLVGFCLHKGGGCYSYSRDYLDRTEGLLGPEPLALRLSSADGKGNHTSPVGPFTSLTLPYVE